MAASNVRIQGYHDTLLNAVTAVSNGPSVMLPTTMSKFTAQAVVTGAPTTVSVKLQGSLDGTNWYDLTTSASTTGDFQFALDKPMKYVRGSLATLTGGTSPTVTLLVAAFS